MKGKVALVTGGSSRIGRATALAFAKEGAQVVIASRSKTKATKAVRAIEKLGSEVSWIQADVSDTTQVQNMVRQTVARFGRLDYAFNNGGSGGKGGLTAEMEEHDWDVNQWLFEKRVVVHEVRDPRDAEAWRRGDR
jgi:NAD(P)-dependent dehydrogenase (short-subunit alcohol dehydrogenase family)